MVQLQKPDRIRTAVSDAKNLTVFVRRVRFLVKLASGSLAVFFVWLQFKNFSNFLIITTHSYVTLRFIVGLYYFSWVLGINFDLGLQEVVYIKAPQKGKITIDMIFLFLCLPFLEDFCA